MTTRSPDDDGAKALLVADALQPFLDLRNHQEIEHIDRRVGQREAADDPVEARVDPPLGHDGRSAHSPRYWGCRFSRNAAIPSSASALAKTCFSASRSRSRAPSMGSSMPWTAVSLIMPTANAGPSATLRA